MIKSEDRILLDGIYITRKHIFIGTGKVVITKAGLYNQILGYLKRSKRDNVLQEWLCERHGVKSLTDDIKRQYEDELRADERNSLYSECLRIKSRGNKGFEFYGVANGNELSYLGLTDNPSIYSVIRNYLRFNTACRAKAKELNISIMSLSVNAIKKEIDECLELDLLENVKDIQVLSNNPDQYCLAYFDLGLLVDNTNSTPAWDNFICGFKNSDTRECFMAALYSLFVGLNRSRQVIYLVGAGDTGKTRVANVIASVLMKLNDEICTALEPLAYQDRFSTSSYVYKWFVLAADNKDLNILRTTLIKNITGNDWVATVEKGQNKDKSHLFSRVFVTSNQIPWCDVSKPEELSRILLFQLDPVLAKTARNRWDVATMGEWAELLQNEAINFLGKCKPYYDKWLSQDGHNLIQYDGMKDILLSGIFFIKRDLRTWWNLCIKEYDGENTTNVLKLSQLADDFSRFIGSKNHNGKYDYSIRSFLSTMLMENNIVIHQLNIGNELVINGYDFIEKDVKKRATSLAVIENEINQVNNGSKLLIEVN